MPSTSNSYLSDSGSLNESLTSTDSHHSASDVTNRLNDYVFNPVPLDTEYPEFLQSACGSEYLSEDQVQAKYNEIGDSFSLYHANVRSINKNFDSLQHSLIEMSHEFQIIGLTETWLKSDPDPLLVMPGYNMEFKNRQNQTGGGVMMYIKDH